MRVASDFSIHVPLQPGAEGRILPPYVRITYTDIVFDEISYDDDDSSDSEGTSPARTIEVVLIRLHIIVSSSSSV